MIVTFPCSNTFISHPCFPSLVYSVPQAKGITSDNLQETLAELFSISLGPANVHFLAQLLSELIQHLETSNVAKLPNSQAKTEALQLVLAETAKRHDFPTVICKALDQATRIGNNPNVGLTFTSLVQYLTSSCISTLDLNPGVIVLCTAICSGWSSISTDSLVLDLANRILISSLEKEREKVTFAQLHPVLRQGILIVLTSSEVSIVYCLPQNGLLLYYKDVYENIGFDSLTSCVSSFLIHTANLSRKQRHSQTHQKIVRSRRS